MSRESGSTFVGLFLLSMSILCWLALPSPARAQDVAIAQVSGNVTDPTGGAPLQTRKNALCSVFE